ncbi:15430_t:CDS:2, partial [Acaulospora colombiana]
ELLSQGLQHIIPHWAGPLGGSGHIDLLAGYFLPIMKKGSTTSRFSIDLLDRIHTSHPPDDVFNYIIRWKRTTSLKYSLDQWGDYVNSLLQTSGKVMNAAGQHNSGVLGAACLAFKRLITSKFNPTD